MLSSNYRTLQNLGIENTSKHSLDPKDGVGRGRGGGFNVFKMLGNRIIIKLL